MRPGGFSFIDADAGALGRNVLKERAELCDFARERFDALVHYEGGSFGLRGSNECADGSEQKDANRGWT